MDDNGLTSFLSQAHSLNEERTGFETFSFEEIVQQTKSHVSNHKSANRKPFASHLVSTTDSLEHAIYKAKRDLNTHSIQDVVLYVVDTHSLKLPTVVILMALAPRAWNIFELVPEWRTRYFAHGALTEWVFRYSIIAAKVYKVSYGKQSWPRRSEINRLTGLEDIIPHVIKATRRSLSKKSGQSRHELYEDLYPKWMQQSSGPQPTLYPPAKRKIRMSKTINRPEKGRTSKDR